MDCVTRDLLNEAIWTKLLKKPKWINIPVDAFEDEDIWGDPIKVTRTEKIPFPDYISDDIIALTLPEQLTDFGFKLVLLKNKKWAAIFEGDAGTFSYTDNEKSRAIVFAALKIIGIDIDSFIGGKK